MWYHGLLSQLAARRWQWLSHKASRRARALLACSLCTTNSRGNEVAIDLDLNSSPTQQSTIHYVLDSWKPGVTNRIQLMQESGSGSAYSGVLHHPGIRLKSHGMPVVLERASHGAKDSSKLYTFLMPPKVTTGSRIIGLNFLGRAPFFPRRERSSNGRYASKRSRLRIDNGS